MTLPERIGRYEICGLAGKGAMGTVYIGHDPFVDRKIAVKVRKINTADYDERTLRTTQKQFFNEAQAAGALDHPHILKIYDAGNHGDDYYIVMEFVEEADTLRSYTEPNKLLPVEMVIKLIRQCAEALHYAHQHGVTHCDIKPANVMLTSKMEVKIGDFGIARRMSGDATQVMGWFGSPLYMSPEQARDEQLTTQTDLYSLGVVIYQLLTGTLPFAGTDIPSTIYKILHTEAVPVEQLRQELPSRLGTIIKRMLAKKLEDRYKNGLEIVRDLDLVLEEIEEPLADLTPEQRYDLAKELKFFKNLTKQDVYELLKAGEWLHYRNGEMVIQEGDFEQSFFVIVAGEVAVKRGSKDIATLKEGDCFGEIGYLTEGKRTASVIADEPLTVIKVSRPAKEWASFPLQMHLRNVFQQTLIDHLVDTSKRLARQQQ